MNLADFENSPSGRLVSTEQNQHAFVPHPLPPRSLDMAKLAQPLSAASHSLGELNGITRFMPNPTLIIAPTQAKEALAFSSMEGTHSTADAMLLAAAGAP